MSPSLGAGSGRASSPSTSHAKPLAPSRAKRTSLTLTPTSRANISGKPVHGVSSERGLRKISTPAVGPGVVAAGGDGVSAGEPLGQRTELGLLREQGEEGVRRASRAELEGELRYEWDMRDKFMERVERLESERDTAERERRELVQSLAGMQTRVDEAFNEQGRLEVDLEGRDRLLEKMRQRVGDLERAGREAQKRSAEQEKSFEAEREAFRAQESHLLNRLKPASTLLPASPLTSRPSSPATNAALEGLHEELASLSASHCTLVAQLNTLSAEVGGLRTRNRELEEENAGWELLMRERTLNGGMRGRGLLGEDWDERDLESEDEDEGEGDDVDVEAGECGSSRRRDGGRRRRGSSKQEEKISRKPRRSQLEMLEEEIEAEEAAGEGGEVHDMEKAGGGLDLAAELGRVAGTPSLPSSGTITAKAAGSGEIEALRAEVKTLKDANKALTLYCSKIIDRIIAQEGFEHVLSVDYKTRRLQTQRSIAKLKTRTSVMDIMQTVQGDSVVPPVPPIPSGIAFGPAASAEPMPVSEEKPKKARPLSMMVRAWSTSPAPVAVEEGKVPAPLTVPIVPSAAAVTEEKLSKEEEAKAAKRAKRGFSLDFRNFGFGSSSATTTPATATPSEPKGLKPLTLPLRSVSGSQLPQSRSATSSPLMTSPSSCSGPGIGLGLAPAEYTARKLEVQAEDEEDRRERHRMEAAMRLMGIDRSSVSPPSCSRPLDSNATEREEIMLPSSTSPPTSMRGTPLSRLSSHLSARSSSTLSPALELTDPLGPVTAESTAQALADFDQRQRDQARAMAQGKHQTEFTSPERGSSGKRASARKMNRTVSGGGGGDGVEELEDTAREGKRMSQAEVMRQITRGRMSKSESISTLWSAGSGSPRNSMEVQP